MASTNLMNLDKAVELISKAGDVIKSLVDGISYAFEKGVSGYDEIAARRTYNRLLDIRAKLAAYYRIPNTNFYQNLTKTADELDMVARFHSKWVDPVCQDHNKRKSDIYPHFDQKQIDSAIERLWNDLLAYIENAEIGLDELIILVKEERSGFITEKIYDDLLTTLSQRKQAFKILRDADFPKSNDELKAIQQISRSYKKMREDLDIANASLANYLKQEYHAPREFFIPNKKQS